MARLVLQFPEDVYCYATTVTVRNTDINSANHLSNDAMISEARSRFLFEYGFGEPTATSLGFIVTDLAITYRAEAHARDQLRFEVGVMDFNRYGGDVIFRISRPADGTLIAMAKSGFVFFDYPRSNVEPMPAAFRARFPNANSLG